MFQYYAVILIVQLIFFSIERKFWLHTLINSSSSLVFYTPFGPITATTYRPYSSQFLLHSLLFISLDLPLFSLLILVWVLQIWFSFCVWFSRFYLPNKSFWPPYVLAPTNLRTFQVSDNAIDLLNSSSKYLLLCIK